MATLHSLPVAREAAPDPLTPARHRLRQTIAAVDRVSRETNAAAEQLHRLYQRDQAARGEWIASGRVGPDPGDAADTRSLNARIVAMQDEFAAAKATLPAKEQVHRDAVSPDTHRPGPKHRPILCGRGHADAVWRLDRDARVGPARLTRHHTAQQLPATQ
jgi:hypothetical protein